MIQLIYASSATQLLSAQELIAILDKARQKNTLLGVTGMLLYKNGNFLQVLEGEATVVKPLYAIIEADPRHYDVQMIAERSVEARYFEKWSMAFTNLDGIDPESIPNYSQFLNEPFTPHHFSQTPSLAHVFLDIFKENMR